MKTFLQIILLLIPVFVFSQDYSSKVNLGFGAGLDYGGIGGRVTVTPSRNFGIFGSVGYAIAGVGFNGGIQGIFNSKSRVVPYLTGMYGYNAALSITGSIETKKLYYGPSFGFGMKVISRRSEANFWNFEFLIPIRPQDYEDDLDYYKNLGVEFKQSPLPFTVSIGYHFSF